MKPQYLYRLGEGATAYATGAGCLTIQQRDPLAQELNARAIFLEPAELSKLRDAIDDYLAATEHPNTGRV